MRRSGHPRMPVITYLDCWFGLSSLFDTKYKPNHIRFAGRLGFLSFSLTVMCCNLQWLVINESLPSET
jgi:hypothetical protein